MKDNKGKDLILRNTFELLLQRGYDGVSVSDIQKACGVSRGLLYHYYKSKEELFLAVVDKFFMVLYQFDDSLTSCFTLPQMIDYIEQYYIGICQNNRLPDGTMVSVSNYDFLFSQVEARSETFARRYHDAKGVERLKWCDVVRNSIDRGEIDKRFVPESVAMICVYIIDGVWMNEGYNSDPIEVIKKIGNALRLYYEQIKN